MILSIKCFRSMTFSCFKASCVGTNIMKYSTHHLKFKEIEDGWKGKDGISENFNLIYKAPMDNILKYLASYLTISTGTIACCSVYYSSNLYKYAASVDPVMLSSDVVFANSGNETLLFLVSYLGFNVALKMLLSKYVLRLYSRDDEYIAVFRGYFHNTITKHSFKLNEFEKQTSPFFVSWSDARFTLGKKKAIILGNYFKTPEYYNCLLTKKTYEETE